MSYQIRDEGFTDADRGLCFFVDINYRIVSKGSQPGLHDPGSAPEFEYEIKELRFISDRVSGVHLTVYLGDDEKVFIAWLESQIHGENEAWTQQITERIESHYEENKGVPADV